MDIKSKSYSKYKGVNIIVFFFCVVFFISSLTIGTLALNEETRLHGTGIGIDDLLYYSDYESSGAFQTEFQTKAFDLLDLIGYTDESYSIENKRYLDQIKGFNYYVSDGEKIVSNLSGYENDASVTGADFTGLTGDRAYLIYENGELVKNPASEDALNGRIRNNDSYLMSNIAYSDKGGYKVYFSFDKDFMSEREVVFKEVKSNMLKWLIPLGISSLLTLICLIWLLVMTGKRDKEGNRPSYRIDKVFTEIQLAVITACFAGGGFLFLDLLFSSLGYHPYYYGEVTAFSPGVLLQMGLAILLGVFSASLGLMFVLSTIRNLKAGQFIKNSIIYKILAAIFKGIVSVYHGGSIMRKVVLVTLAVCIVSATVFLAPVVAIAILIFAPKWVKKYEEVRRGVREVKNGNLTYKIPALGVGELGSLAADINEISQASYVAIQNELKNQRLKTDLISNVSHDLKTPLTSIITYIDLLKTEGLNSENAPQYLEVLDQKSMRLQKLTEDLFDAAKASSGAIPVRIEKVDMLSLIKQGLGEMVGRIDTSGLDFIINAEDESYMVKADGQLLWRVVENLLGNVLKYALEGSRVYIDIKEIEGVNGKEGQVLLEIKNISKDELNINADELLERFKRGDDARSTEGSGLGLAIARDLVILQKGWFEIKIDGDLFKALVMLPKAP